jgi:hypothetical protein
VCPSALTVDRCRKRNERQVHNQVQHRWARVLSGFPRENVREPSSRDRRIPRRRRLSPTLTARRSDDSRANRCAKGQAGRRSRWSALLLAPADTACLDVEWDFPNGVRACLKCRIGIASPPANALTSRRSDRQSSLKPRRGDVIAQMPTQEPQHLAADLHRRDVRVRVKLIDALDLERHMTLRARH